MEMLRESMKIICSFIQKRGTYCEIHLETKKIRWKSKELFETQLQSFEKQQQLFKFNWKQGKSYEIQRHSMKIPWWFIKTLRKYNKHPCFSKNKTKLIGRPLKCLGKTTSKKTRKKADPQISFLSTKKKRNVWSNSVQRNNALNPYMKHTIPKRNIFWKKIL
jgi:hypothetical protein